MSAEKRYSLDWIHRQVHQIPGYEHVSKLEIPIGDGTAWLLVYEKFFFRSSYASLTILLTEYGQAHAAYIVSSGGGDGMSNLSFGANRKMAMECVHALEELGFAVNPETSDKLPESLLDRFFK